MASKIAILGSGDVAQILGKGLLSKGYEVTLGSREPKSAKLQEWLSANPKGNTALSADAAKWGDIVIIATVWGENGKATQDALKLVGSENLKGKVVLDATNPLKFEKSGPSLEIGTTTSGGEVIQSWIPDARVVKAYNTISVHQMIDPPTHNGVKPDMWIAGNDADAKKIAADIIKRGGYESVIDMGDITRSRLLEPFAMLWITYGFTNNHWTHSFALLNGKK